MTSVRTSKKKKKPGSRLVDDLFSPERQPLRREVVVDRTGEVRQAGASQKEGKFVKQIRLYSERSLYFFAKEIMGLYFLTPTLHKTVCDWLSTTPPLRKLLLIPRKHGKSCIVSQSLPIHILIQPRTHNIYTPNIPGCDSRILLALESESRALDHMRVIQQNFEGNELLRALWPHLLYPSFRRDSPKWTEREMVFNREHRFADPSIRGVGVGQKIVGAHPNVIIKDDLCTEAAANSTLVMEDCKQWHVLSRALLADRTQSLEFIIGTHWHVADLYTDILQDPTVESFVMGMYTLEENKKHYIWAKDSSKKEPNGFDEKDEEELRREFGTFFPLLFMNNTTSQDLVDFPEGLHRHYQLINKAIHFFADERDDEIAHSITSSDENTTPFEVEPGEDLFDVMQRAHDRGVHLTFS